MVDLVLNDLRDPARIGGTLKVETLILKGNFNGLITDGLSYSIQRQAAFRRFIPSGFLDDFRIVHANAERAGRKRDDPLMNADHIGRHTDASFLIGFQRIHQIRQDLRVVLSGPC